MRVTRLSLMNQVNPNRQRSSRSKTAQQSVPDDHLDNDSVRFANIFWHQVFSTPKHRPRMQTVRRFIKRGSIKWIEPLG